MSAELNKQQWDQVDSELAGGRKIQAIKLHREFTGSDLRTAKDAVEARLAELRIQDPQKYPATKTGCMPMLLVFVSTLSLVVLRALL